MFHRISTCHGGTGGDSSLRPCNCGKIEPDKFISSFSYVDISIGQYRYAHLADIARLEILIKYGGIYVI